MATKTSNKNAKQSTKATKAQPKPATKKTAEPVAAEVKPQKEETKKPEPKATPKPGPKKASEKVDPKATTPRPRDLRLPAPGTVIQKKDRQGTVRCECTVEADGVRYNGNSYRSLSSAAMAASKDLGLGGRAMNGFLFWGLIKQPVRETDPIAALEHAWERYRSRTEAILKASVTDENRVKVLTTVRKHVDALEVLRQSVA